MCKVDLATKRINRAKPFKNLGVKQNRLNNKSINKINKPQQNKVHKSREQILLSEWDPVKPLKSLLLKYKENKAAANRIIFLIYKSLLERSQTWLQSHSNYPNRNLQAIRKRWINCEVKQKRDKQREKKNSRSKSAIRRQNKNLLKISNQTRTTLK